MTPAEVLALPVQRVETDLWALFCGRFVMVWEAGEHADEFAAHSSPRIQIDVVRERYDGNCNCWRVAVVRLDGQAVMITRNAGRFGDDLATRVILSRDLFRRLIEHLRTMRKPGPEVDVQNSEGTLVAEDLEADLPRLTHFYFGDLNGPTENEGPPGGAGGL